MPLGLIHCTLEEDVMLRDCTLPGLYLTGTHLPKLNAQRLQCNGPLHLSGGFQATGLVDMSVATIIGQLDCDDGKFLAKDKALECDAITVGASVFLRGKFEAQGEVNLHGAKIDGQLDCTGGRFLAKDKALNCETISVGADVLLSEEFEARGRIVLFRAVITGNLQISGATLTTGLVAQGMRVRAGFFWRNVTGDGIEVDLIDAHVGTLIDSPGSWTSVKRLRLSSFRYDRIESKMDVQERLDWLAKHDATVCPFTPQPYVQLANVLRRQGMISAVNTVMIKRKDLQRDADMEQAVQGNEWWGLFALVMLLRPFLSLPFKWMFGYGHQPARVLLWIAAILGITFWFAQKIHIHGQFAPTSSVVLPSQDWLDSFPTDPVPDSPLWRVQLDAWAQTTSGRDYTSFSAFLYALDLFIPLDALGQEKNWAPSAERGWWGDWGHQLRWLVQMAGWVITAIGAAVVTGLIGRRD